MVTLTKKKNGSGKRASKVSDDSGLANCPVNGAGWCPYPFSPKELAKLRKRKAQASAKPAAGSTKSK